MTDYSELNTGDILLFKHYDNYNGIIHTVFTLLNKAIRYFTGSKYSHSAIVVKDPRFTSNQLTGLYILESNSEPFQDSENNQYKLGVELSSFDKVINTYNGEIYWRKLECKRDEEFYDKLDNIHSIIHNRPYDLIPSDWLNAMTKTYKKNTQRKKTFYCSALVSFIYTKLGFLDEKTPWTLISPEQLGTEHSDTLTFINCKVEPEVSIFKK